MRLTSSRRGGCARRGWRFRATRSATCSDAVARPASGLGRISTPFPTGASSMVHWASSLRSRRRNGSPLSRSRWWRFGRRSRGRWAAAGSRSIRRRSSSCISSRGRPSSGSESHSPSSRESPGRLEGAFPSRAVPLTRVRRRWTSGRMRSSRRPSSSSGFGAPRGTGHVRPSEHSRSSPGRRTWSRRERRPRSTCVRRRPSSWTR